MIIKIQGKEEADKETHLNSKTRQGKVLNVARPDKDPR